MKIIEGTVGSNFGDLDGNGIAENPGDGRGVIWYAEDAVLHAKLAAEAAPDDTWINLHAQGVWGLDQDVSGIAMKAREVALAGLAVDDVDKARDIMKEMEAILQEALETSRRAYLEAQAMGTYVLEAPPIQLTLFKPGGTDRTVIVNGVVSAVEGLSWDWGDGTSNDSFFPAEHTYAAVGTYTITVAAFDALGRTATETVEVTLPLPGPGTIT